MYGSTSARQQEVQRIMDALQEAILQHRLLPGMRLIEAQIVDVLKANRNHVQAALRRLAMLNIVTIAPHRGASVAQPEVREAREVFAARLAIEGALIESITPAKMQLFSDEIARYQLLESQAIDGGERNHIIQVMHSFHLLLATISGNQVLKEILSNLLVRSALVVARFQRGAQNGKCRDEHRQVLELLSRGEGDLARSLLLAHLSQIEQQLHLQEGTLASADLSQILIADSEQKKAL